MKNLIYCICGVFLFVFCACATFGRQSQASKRPKVLTKESVYQWWKSGKSIKTMTEEELQLLGQYFRYARFDSVHKNWNAGFVPERNACWFFREAMPWFVYGDSIAKGGGCDYVTLAAEGETVTLHCNVPFMMIGLSTRAMDGQLENYTHDVRPLYYLSQDVFFATKGEVPVLKKIINHPNRPYTSRAEHFWLSAEQSDDTTLIVRAESNPNQHFRGREMMLQWGVAGIPQTSFRGFIRFRQPSKLQ